MPGAPRLTLSPTPPPPSASLFLLAVLAANSHTARQALFAEPPYGGATSGIH